MNSNPIQRVLDHLDGVKQTSENQWQTRCPAHDDAHASLSIGRGADGRVLLHCHAGCATADVLAKIGLKDIDLFSPSASLAPRPPASSASVARIVATYDYCDSAGALLFQVVRFDPKDFRQRRPDSNGGWIWNLNGVPRVLYRLPELLAADLGAWVFVVEGEKDADTLANIGLVATTNPGGAGRWAKLADDSALRGRRVAIIPDRDEAGRKHAEDVARRLHGKAADVRIIDLGAIDGFQDKDATDWAEWRDGQTAEELAAALSGMAEAAPLWKPSDGGALEPGPLLICMADVEPRPVQWLWPGRVPLGRITLLVGRQGEGKSFLTIDMAARVTTGTPWPDGSPCPAGSVILISAEDDPGDTIRPRLDAHRADVQRVHLLKAVRHLDDQGKPHEVMFTLADVAELEAALMAHPDCVLIVVDPIGSFIGGRTDVHRDNEVRGVLAPVAMLAEKYGPAVLVVAHRRKSGANLADDLALGSRAFTGIPRAVWHLSRDPENKARRLLLPGKNNLGPEGGGLAFTICGDPPAIAWERNPVDLSADDALAAENISHDGKPGPEPEAQRQAVQWLEGELADLQEHPVKTIREAAKAAGLSWRSVQRASADLRVKLCRPNFGGECAWLLPKAAPIGAKPAGNEELGTNGTNGDSQGKMGDSEEHSCHACQDNLLGGNGGNERGGG